MRTLAALLLTACSLAACTAAPPASAPILGPGRPALVVAYTPENEIRMRFEDLLGEALADDGVETVASHLVAADVDLLDHDLLLRAARERDAPVILMVRRLTTGAIDDSLAPPERVAHRTLRAYLADARRGSTAVPGPGRQFIDVSAYLRDGPAAELVWSGYSWVDVDGDPAPALERVAGIVAENVAAARRAVRDLR